MSANGRTHNEIESVYYLKLNDASLQALNKADSSEYHEQWQVKAPHGSIRVRALSATPIEKSESDIAYILTIKKDGKENEMPIRKESFELFKATSDRGMFKRRFTFDIDVSQMDAFQRAYWRGLKWEVDVFILPDGNVAPWCKVDLEVNNTIQKHSAQRPRLPIPYSALLTERPQDKDAVGELYDKYFLRSK